MVSRVHSADSCRIASGGENVMFIVFLGEGGGIAWARRVRTHADRLPAFRAADLSLLGRDLRDFIGACRDTFGDAHVTANAGALYTTKGVAALLVPLGSAFKEMTGSWTTVSRLLCRDSYRDCVCIEVCTESNAARIYRARKSIRRRGPSGCQLDAREPSGPKWTPRISRKARCD